MHHTHQWIEDSALTDRLRFYICTDCAETTNGCNTCGNPLETNMTTCRPCIDRARQTLADLKVELTAIPLPTLGLKAIRYDRDRITTSDDDARLPHGLDATVDDPDKPGLAGVRTAQGIHDVLITWAEAWADERAEVFAGDPFTYLHTYTLWAAQNHPAWTDYLDDVRRLLGKARHLAGNTSERQNVPCIYCSGTIVRDWTPHGLNDQHRCTRCGTAWNTEAEMLFANRHALQALPETHPDRLVTREEARAIHPNLKRNTLNKWINRGDIKPHATNRRGQPTYRLSDITARLMTTV